MSIRATILSLAVPLFLALAIVNGALLYFQQKAEMERAFADQALAVTVTVAEFIREMPDPAADLADPLRRRALNDALRHVEGLDGLYLLEPGQAPWALQPAASRWDITGLVEPTRPVSAGPKADAHGFWVTALAPAGGERFVAGRLNADPILATMEAAARRIIGFVLLSGLFAAGLGVFVARRITGELELNRQLLIEPAAGAAVEQRLRIREAQNLAEAVRLMEAGREAADRRSRVAMERPSTERDLPETVRQIRSEVFAPHECRHGPVEIGLRICGDVPAGSFFAHVATEKGGALVLGWCAAGGIDELLASAVAIRRLIDKCQSDAELDTVLALIARSYPVERIDIHRWNSDEAAGGHTRLFSMTDEDTAARGDEFLKANPGLSPAALLNSLAVLLCPDGVFGALRLAPQPSATSAASVSGSMEKILVNPLISKTSRTDGERPARIS